jgi:NTP pyrophosphatase (non-canonical NTP hydrolase)
LGSTSFVKEMVSAVDELKKLGHEGWIHPHYIDYVNQENHPHFARYENGEHAQIKIENDYLNQHYKAILESDAVLIINLEKNGIKNYIGGNVLIEMGQAYVNNKKIFLLNSIPEMKYTEEIIALKPISLNGDLSKIPTDSRGFPTLKEISNEGEVIEDEVGVTFDDILNKLTQEFGEFNDAVQKFRGRYSRKKVSIEEVKKELGDVIFNLSSICNKIGINPNEFNEFAFETLNKFKERKEEYKR